MQACRCIAALLLSFRGMLDVGGGDIFASNDKKNLPQEKKCPRLLSDRLGYVTLHNSITSLDSSGMIFSNLQSLIRSQNCNDCGFSMAT